MPRILTVHRIRYARTLLLGALVCAGSGTRASGAVRAQLYAAQWVLDHGVARAQGGLLEFTSLAGVPVSVQLDPALAAVSNPSRDGEFHPFTAELAQAALSELRALPGADLPVVIYCLPGLPQPVQSSYSVGNEIFLSAAVGPISPRVAAYTVTHELGHVLQHARVPASASLGWQEFLRVRGLTDARRYSASAPHRNRPTEIFAEDFRALYGGPLATYSGTVENPELPDPAAVAGLSDYFEDLLRGRFAPTLAIQLVSNFPNPFNPSTTIHVRLHDDAATMGGWVQLEIIDARGRVVRRLEPLAAAPDVAARWDGQDDRGEPVASGRYLYRVSFAGETAVGRMLLLK